MSESSGMPCSFIWSATVRSTGVVCLISATSPQPQQVVELAFLLELQRVELQPQALEPVQFAKQQVSPVQAHENFNTGKLNDIAILHQ